MHPSNRKACELLQDLEGIEDRFAVEHAMRDPDAECGLRAWDATRQRSAPTPKREAANTMTDAEVTRQMDAALAKHMRIMKPGIGRALGILRTELRDEIAAEIAKVRDEVSALRDEVTQLQTELADLRSDMIGENAAATGAIRRLRERPDAA
jgi:hypothetical protein